MEPDPFDPDTADVVTFEGTEGETIECVVRAIGTGDDGKEYAIVFERKSIIRSPDGCMFAEAYVFACERDSDGNIGLVEIEDDKMREEVHEGFMKALRPDDDPFADLANFAEA